jgi:hypothetical protein
VSVSGAVDNRLKIPCFNLPSSRHLRAPLRIANGGAIFLLVVHQPDVGDEYPPMFDHCGDHLSALPPKLSNQEQRTLMRNPLS